MGQRESMRQEADSLGVTGWVRNLPDGRVEALVEGEADAVTRVERLLWQGPGGARVSAVAVDDTEPASGAYHEFSVRR